jgi:hypothetical protein
MERSQDTCPACKLRLLVIWLQLLVYYTIERNEKTVRPRSERMEGGATPTSTRMHKARSGVQKKIKALFGATSQEASRNTALDADFSTVDRPTSRNTIRNPATTKLTSPDVLVSTFGTADETDALAYGNTYEYSPIHVGTSIRILKLYPGTGNEPLRGELNEVDLDTHPRFKALSYAWGDATQRNSFICGSKSVFLTRSLCDALRRFRLAREELYIWADGLCIKQQDTIERNHQVQLMGRIYKTAEQVVVWLGDDPTNSARSVFEHRQSLEDLNVNHAMDSKRGSPFDELANCSWFHRVWVMQEAILGQDTTVFWGPKYRVSLSKLRESLQAAISMGHNSQTQSQQDAFTWLIKASSYDIELGFDIFEVLEWVRTKHCKDDRDRIYSILGLPYRYKFPWWNTWLQNIKPDYNIAISELFLDVATEAARNGAIIYLLNAVHHGPELGAWESNSEPSWVPRWDSHLAHNLNLATLTGFSIQTVSVSWFSLQHRAIHITGAHVDDVAICSKNSLLHSTGDLNIASIHDFWIDIQAMTTNDRIKVYYRSLAICALVYGVSYDVNPGEFPMPNSTLEWCIRQNSHERNHAKHGSHKRMLKTFDRSLQHEVIKSPMKSISLPSFQRRWGQRLHGRRLFRTKKGLMGLGPEAMHTGDVVFALDASDVPIVVRPQGPFYRFVGVAVVLRNEWSEWRDKVLEDVTLVKDIEIR